MIIDLNNDVVIGAEGVERIAQQVRTVLKTVKGTVPFNRDFGIDFSFIDKPIPVARALAISSVIEEVEKQVDGIEVIDVSFPDDSELVKGVLKPKVEIKIIES